MSMIDDDRQIIAEFEKNGTEVVRVAFTTYKGVELLDIRTWYDAGQKPGKGLTLRRDLLPDLAAAIRQAEQLQAGT